LPQERSEAFARQSIKWAISSIDQRRSVTLAAIAGVIRKVSWNANEALGEKSARIAPGGVSTK
jgi:hypothetical protein